MWVLPVIYMLMGYSRRMILACGAVAIGLYLVMATLTPGGSLVGTVVMQLSVLVTALFMVLLGATAREERERILRTLRNRLATLATTDELTGCVNVRAFTRIEASELARAARYGHAISLLAVDVDHFKQLNDGCGHLFGDRVLRAVADARRGAARETDVIARLGGDGFAVLCPETGAPAAAQLAAWLCKAVTRLSIDGAVVTLSVGVCTLHPGEEPADALRGRADAALYAAKERGRNQFVAWASGAVV